MSNHEQNRCATKRRPFLKKSGTLAVATAIAGCLGGGDGSASDDGGGSGAITTDSLPTFENEAGVEVGKTFEAVRELAAEEDTGTMYATLDREPVSQMLNAFHEKYPDASVEHITGGSEDLSSRWDSEYKSGNAEASIAMWGGSSVGSIWRDGQAMEMSADFMPSLGEMSEDYKSKDGYWIAARLHMASYFYNTDMVSENDASGWMDLVTNDRWSDQNIGHDPTPNTFYITWMYEKFGREYFQKLADRQPRWVDSHTDLAKFCGAGEFPVSFTYTHKMAEFASDLPVDYFKFDPHPGLISPALINNKAPQPNTAILFLNYWSSKEGQQQLGTTQYLPWHSEAEYKGYPGLVNNDNYDIEFVAPDIDTSEAVEAFQDELNPAGNR